jgi:selenium metabolism protein YedF
MSKKVEFISVACPAPVMGVKKEIDNGTTGVLEVVVDNTPARENVLRFLKSQGKEILKVVENGAITTITTNLGGEAKLETSAIKNEAASGVSYVVNSEIMGRGEDELGKMLLIGFLSNLPKTDDLPKSIFFLNSGIKLALNSSPALEALQELEKNGTEIFVCGTCTEHYSVTDQLGVGVLGNIYDLTNLYQQNRVVTL